MGQYGMSEYHLFNGLDPEDKPHLVARFLGGDEVEIFVTQDDGTEPETGVLSLNKKDLLAFCDMLNGFERMS